MLSRVPVYSPAKADRQVKDVSLSKCKSQVQILKCTFKLRSMVTMIHNLSHWRIYSKDDLKTTLVMKSIRFFFNVESNIHMSNDEYLLEMCTLNIWFTKVVNHFFSNTFLSVEVCVISIVIYHADRVYYLWVTQQSLISTNDGLASYRVHKSSSHLNNQLAKPSTLTAKCLQSTLA